MTDSFLDFIGMVLLLGICVAVAFGVIVPLTNTEKMQYNVVLEDKSAPSIKGYENTSAFDGRMSKEEVVLMTQVQDFSMPEPRKFKIGATEIEVKSLYREDLVYYWATASSALRNIDPSGVRKFVVEYKYGTSYKPDDDYYEITKK